MSIKIKVHSVDKNSNSAVITILDGDRYVIDKKNIFNVWINSDGSANTAYLTLCAKYITFRDRLEKIDEAEDDLL